MKKILGLFLIIFSFSYGEIGQYKSNFGLGVGLGMGYDFKGIYRQNDWLSLSLNYNILKVDGISQNVSGLDVTGGLVFSTPGVIINYHPFGGNFRVAGGFLYDLGGLNINVDGALPFDTNGDGTSENVSVTGSVSIKLGRTYPYIGIAYGYDLSSVVHMELTLGTYLVKRPDVNLYFNVGSATDIAGILTSVGITGQTQTDIIAALTASGGNILDLPQIIADQFGLPNTVIMPSEQNLENDIVTVIQEGYAYLPEFLGYNLLPVVSIGFTVFPF